MILGVSEWVASKINMQTSHVRIGFVISLFLGFGILLYLILWIIKMVKG